jgi:hypothetical protein
MMEMQFHSQNTLSDDLLEMISGGIMTAEMADVISRLDQAANNDDFDSFSQIMTDTASTCGKPFVADVIHHYTENGFLSSSRFAHLFANLLTVL